MSQDAPSAAQQPRRILIVDDNPEIHSLIRGMLAGDSTTDLDAEIGELEDRLFDKAPQEAAQEAPLTAIDVPIDSATQGQDAIDMVSAAPRGTYIMAFVDMRMPPGIDGLQTIKGLWEHDPDLYTVICTAYSDFGWGAISAEIGYSPNLLILRKPFEACEIRQIVAAISKLYDVLGKVSEMMGTIEADLIAAYERIQTSENALASIVSLTPTPIISLSDDGAIQIANAAAEDLLGVDRERLGGAPFAEWFDQSLDQSECEGVVRVPEGRVVAVSTTVVESASGRHVILAPKDAAQTQAAERTHTN